MKKVFKYLALAVASVATLACTVEPIVFDHEHQAFESREDMILIEGIMPLASAADEEIYIVGPFNGDSLMAVKNPAYLMERSAVIPQKWGVYLDPNDFVDGKTLADGFTFFSVKQGWERSSVGQAVCHTLDIKAGEWANVYVDKWAKYFQKDEGPAKLPVHDGTVRVYIVDQTGWSDITLYQWGDTNNLGGGWPGMAVSGTLDYEGVVYKYFEYAEDEVVGKSQNLIFSNNGADQLGDFALTFEAGTPDYFLTVSLDGVTAMDAPQAEEKLPEHDGQVWVSIIDRTGWDEIALYQWGSTNDLGGGWPGAQVAGTFDYKGETWKYFAYATDEVVGKGQNLIFNNNNNGTQLGDYALTFEEGVTDYLLVVTADGVTVYGEGSDTPDPEPGPDDPDPVDPPAGESSVLYIAQDCGWDAVALYAWGDKECFGGWPGKTPDASVSLCGVKYSTWNLSAEFSGLGENLILNNNNGGAQADGPKVTLGTNLVYSIASDKSWTLVENPSIRVYVTNNTGWDALYLYSWGGGEYFGGWPGSAPAGKQTVNGVEYDYFDVPAEAFANAGACNFIFNNNSGTQYENDPGLKGNTATHDFFFALSATGASVIE